MDNGRVCLASAREQLLWPYLFLLMVLKSLETRTSYSLNLFNTIRADLSEIAFNLETLNDLYILGGFVM